MDPNLPRLPADASSDSRSIVAALLLLVIVATQAAIAVKPVNRAERAIAVVLIGVAVSVWLIRI